jgi:nucleoside-diphosphate-sugar epimerase
MILVTGGTGLLGAHLLYQLALENDVVKAIYRTKSSLDNVKTVFSYYTDEVDALFSKIIWIPADITDVPSLEIAFSKVSHVYHVAAVVSFNARDYKRMRHVNIEGTANVVNFCIAEKIQKLCFVSSIATIGAAIKSAVVTEENEWNGEADNSGYSITKYGAEMEVWRASQEGVAVVIVNPGVILGPGFWKLNTGTLFSKGSKGFTFYTEGVSGFVGVIDVAKAMLLLMQSALKNERFILVSENASFKEVCSLIAHEFGKKAPTINISKWMTSIAWKIDFLFSRITGTPQRFTKEVSKSVHNTTRYSSKKLQASLNFEFTPIKNVIAMTCKRY